MTKLKFLVFLLFTIVITSCSSDETQSAEPNFSFTYNDKVQKINFWNAQKQGDFLTVLATSEEGKAIYFTFNSYGNLFETNIGPLDINTGDFYESSKNFSSNSFTFSLENLDTKNKTVKVKFSGKVFENGNDDLSDYININGSFEIPYIDKDSPLEGQGTFAKLDGKDWHGLAMSTSIINQGESSITYLNVVNDGEYQMGFVFPTNNLKTGTFTFTDNTFLNRVFFQKYDTQTHEYINYDVSGTLTYTTVNNSYVTGTFNFTATNPVTKAKITVSNGIFKEIYGGL
jgi:hypothetical protein